MAAKTTWTDADPVGFVEAVSSPRRRRDALTLLELMRRVTGDTYGKRAAEGTQP